MNTKLLSYVVKTSLFLPFLWDRFWAFFYKKSMGSCGKNVMLKPATSVFKGIENFYIASDVRIARYAVIYSTVAKVYIGSKVEIAPHLKIITGNHNFQSVGHFMFDGNYSKNKSDDRDVIIEGDSWLGINVTLLSGGYHWAWFMHSSRCSCNKINASIFYHRRRSCKSSQIQIHT